MRKQRLLMQESNPHYLKPIKRNLHNSVAQDEMNIPSPSQNNPPVVEPTNGGESGDMVTTRIVFYEIPPKWTDVSSFLDWILGLKLASSDKFAMEMQKQFKEMSKANGKASGCVLISSFSNTNLAILQLDLHLEFFLKASGNCTF